MPFIKKQDPCMQIILKRCAELSCVPADKRHSCHSHLQDANNQALRDQSVREASLLAAASHKQVLRLHGMLLIEL